MNPKRSDHEVRFKPRRRPAYPGRYFPGEQNIMLSSAHNSAMHPSPSVAPDALRSITKPTQAQRVRTASLLVSSLAFLCSAPRKQNANRLKKRTWSLFGLSGLKFGIGVPTTGSGGAVRFAMAHVCRSTSVLPGVCRSSAILVALHARSPALSMRRRGSSTAVGC